MTRGRSREITLLNWLALERATGLPLYKQIADQIRGAILSGRLAPFAYLPASRTLAADLAVSRVTTLQAYEQLTAEGFLETRAGSGTRVAGALAGNPLERVVAARKRLGDKVPHSEVGVQEELHDGEIPGAPFQPGIPACDEFPRLIWSRLLQRHALRRDQSILGYAHMGGYAPLRQELAKYLSASRGVICTAEQVIITTSVRAAIGTLCSVLLPAGSRIVVEDPGYVTGRRSFHDAGLLPCPVPVDAEGLRVEDHAFEAEDCIAAYVTPAHQWPTGVTLSARRRLRLLDWAVQRNRWVIEDDYDSEFRFQSPPVATLHSLAAGQRVIYIGTFSKTLVPSIRCAYLVGPPDRASGLRETVFQRGCEPSLHLQAALSDLLAEGHFVRHITRMRKLYRRRRDVLIASVEEAFGDRLRIIVPQGGLQIIAELPSTISAAQISHKGSTAGLVVRAMEEYHAIQAAPNAVHLGFGALPEAEIAPAVQRLKAAVADYL